MYSEEDSTRAASPDGESMKAFRLPLRRAPTSAVEGVSGITVQVVEGAPVITNVHRGSAAAEAGLRPGFVVLQIGDTDLHQYLKSITPFFKSLPDRYQALSEKADQLLAGWEGTQMTVKVLDDKSETKTVKLTLKRPPGIPCSLGELPTEYAEFESTVLPGSIGYMRFNIFMMPLLDDIKKTMASFNKEKAMVIDLRGNPGGLGGMVLAIAGRLIKSELDMGVSIDRFEEKGDVAYPQEPRFDGPVAILIDEDTACASEQLAVCLQDAKRVIVVGRRSRGALAVGTTVKLPDNSRLMYPTQQYKTAKGVVIEGVGVNPDVLVTLTRKDLLAGKDPILDAAVEALRKKMKPSR
jgi:carboxyl-terminal processing protease